MRLPFLALLILIFGCVQIDDGKDDVVVPDVPKPDVVTPIEPGKPEKVDAAFLSALVSDASITKDVCMRYAALFRAFSQSFQERADIPAMMLLNACIKTAGQFVKEPHPLVTAELEKLKTVEKSRELLVRAFDQLSETMRAAAKKK
jgi:hypothetical protein